jgi:hypothetical protein
LTCHKAISLAPLSGISRTASSSQELNFLSSGFVDENARSLSSEERDHTALPKQMSKIMDLEVDLSHRPPCPWMGIKKNLEVHMTATLPGDLPFPVQGFSSPGITSTIPQSRAPIPGLRREGIDKEANRSRQPKAGPDEMLEKDIATHPQHKSTTPQLRSLYRGTAEQKAYLPTIYPSNPLSRKIQTRITTANTAVHFQTARPIITSR